MIRHELQIDITGLHFASVCSPANDIGSLGIERVHVDIIARQRDPQGVTGSNSNIRFRSEQPMVRPADLLHADRSSFRCPEHRGDGAVVDTPRTFERFIPAIHECERMLPPVAAGSYGPP